MGQRSFDSALLEELLGNLGILFEAHESAFFSFTSTNTLTFWGVRLNWEAVQPFQPAKFHRMRHPKCGQHCQRCDFQLRSSTERALSLDALGRMARRRRTRRRRRRRKERKMMRRRKRSPRKKRRRRRRKNLKM